MKLYNSMIPLCCTSPFQLNNKETKTFTIDSFRPPTLLLVKMIGHLMIGPYKHSPLPLVTIFVNNKDTGMPVVCSVLRCHWHMIATFLM